MDRFPKRQPLEQGPERDPEEAKTLIIKAGHKNFAIFVQRDGAEVPIKVEDGKGDV